MRVLQIANGYLKTRVYSLLCPALERRGVEETVLVPVKWGEQVPELPDNVNAVPCFGELDRVLFFRKQKRMLRWLEENTDLGEFDVVHAHTVFSGGYTAYQIHKRYGTPYVVAVRDTDMNTFFRYMVHLRGVGVEILRHASKVIFLSSAYQKSLPEMYIPQKYRQEILEKSMVIPNGIDPMFLQQNAAPRTMDSNAVRLIYVGLLNSRKNPELTVEAVKLLRQQGHNVSLTMVGKIEDEKYRTMLEKNDFVTYYDRCPQEEVIGHLQNADIFVMPSHRETFGLVYAEAMSQGLPVLYTAGQGFDGHFPDGTVGFAVSDQDPAQLAEKILMTVEQYEALSKNSLRCVGRFDWDQIAEQYITIYNELMMRK